jgi:hypothetical protein
MGRARHGSVTRAALALSLALHALFVAFVAVTQVRQLEPGQDAVFYAVVDLTSNAAPRVRTRPVVREETPAPVAPPKWSLPESPKEWFEPVPLPPRPLPATGMAFDLQPTIPKLEPELAAGFDGLAAEASPAPHALTVRNEPVPATPNVAARETERPGLRMSFAIAAESQNLPKDSASFLQKNPLEIIADSIAVRPRGVETDRIDLVFLLDVSQSMQDNIYAVAKYLERMASRLVDSNLDYRVGIVTFRHTTLTSVVGNDLTVTPLTKDISKIRKTLEKVKCKGGEKALNAIVDAIPRVEFRSGASRHFVLVTDEYVDGSYSTREVLGALHRAKIQVDVIGMDEPFQRALAARTGGIWMPITNLAN